MTDFSKMSDEELMRRYRELKNPLTPGMGAPVSSLPASPTTGMSEGELAITGAGKFGADTWRGAQQMMLSPFQGAAVDKRKAALSEEEGEARRLDAPLMDTNSGKLGYMAPAMALTAAGGPVFAPRNFSQAALSGLSYGMLQPSVDSMDKLRTVGLSTGGAIAGQGAGALLQHVARPVTPSALAKRLLSEDVVPTPGQATDPSTYLGRLLRNTEERAGSAPFIGEPINAARERAGRDLNKAALRRTGDTSGEIGLDAVANQAKNIGQELDTLTGQIGNLQISPADVRAITGVQAGLMEDAHEQMLAKQLDLFRNKTGAANGSISGEELAKVRAKWRADAASYSSSGDPSQRELGRALKEAVENLDNFVDTNAPQNIGPALKAARAKYRNLVPVEEAAASAANRPNEPGVFTPQQLFQGVKKSTDGVKRKALTQGRGPQQDLAEAGMILRNTRPDSGTAERLATAGVMGGALAGTGFAAGGKDKDGNSQFDYRIPLALGLLSGGVYGARPMTKYAVGGYKAQEPIVRLIQSLLRTPATVAGAQAPALSDRKK